MNNLINILINIKTKITGDSDLSWTRYDTPQQFLAELNIYINELGSENNSCLDKLSTHFLPASTFQEHSIQNGWADEDIKMSVQFGEYT